MRNTHKRHPGEKAAAIAAGFALLLAALPVSAQVAPPAPPFPIPAAPVSAPTSTPAPSGGSTNSGGTSSSGTSSGGGSTSGGGTAPITSSGGGGGGSTTTGGGSVSSGGSSAPSTPPTTPPSAPTGAPGHVFTQPISIGSSGADVSALQQILIQKGLLNITAPTGYFGPATEAAVAALQSESGLPAVGTVGPLTRTLLNSTNVSTPAAAPTPSAPSAAPSSTTFTRTLSIGSTGADVSALQQILIDKGFLSISSPTGYFGPATAAALARFQSQEGLEAVGSVGPLTRALLNSL